MHSISLADEISIDFADESIYSIRWADGRGIDWAVENDLAVRAHAAVEQHVGRSLPIQLRVTKHIPAGGGLGGGSSDAATTILMINELFGLELTQKSMVGICRSLGSDVSFFLDPDSYSDGHPPPPALVSGDGSTVERTGRREMVVTLIVPPFGCSTGEVYRAFDRMPAGRFDPGEVRKITGELLRDGAEILNDLGESAMMVSPELGKIYQMLEAGLDHGVNVSGSGSTLFVFGKLDVGEIGQIVPGCTVLESSLV